MLVKMQVPRLSPDLSNQCVWGEAQTDVCSPSFPSDSATYMPILGNWCGVRWKKVSHQEGLTQASKGKSKLDTQCQAGGEIGRRSCGM